MPDKKRRIRSLAVKSILICLLILSPTLQTFAQLQPTADEPTRISLSLDKNSYLAGESILATVKVTVGNEENKSKPMVISLYSPAGLYASQETVPVNARPSTTYSVTHTFKISTDAPAGKWVATATYLDAKAELAFSVSSVQVKPQSVYVKIWSDKSKYSIGETAYIQGAVEPVSDEPVLITIIGSDKNTYLSEQLLPDAQGIFKVAFRIREGHPHGTWEAKAEYSGTASSILFNVMVGSSPQPVPIQKISLSVHPLNIKMGDEVSMEISVQDDLSPIILQYSTDQINWHHIVRLQPAYGFADATWSPNITGKIYIRAYFEGDERYRSTASSVVTINVEKVATGLLPISLKVSPHEIFFGDKVTIAAETATVSKEVSLQYSVDEVNWVSIMNIATPRTISWAPEKIGDYYVRAFFAGDDEYGQSVSNVVTLNVQEKQRVQTVDVFTQLGGKGPLNMNGGIFNQGERLLIFALVQGTSTVERTSVTVSVEADATANLEPILHKQIVTDAKGLATISLNTSEMRAGTYVVNARLDKTGAGDSSKFIVVSQKPPDIVDPSQKITPKLYLELSSREIRFGESLVIHVRSEPHITDSIVIQSSKDKLEWDDVTTASLSNGSLRFSWVPETMGSLYLRAYYLGSANYAASNSQPSSLEVKGIETLALELRKKVLLLGGELELLISYLENTDLNLSILDPTNIVIVDTVIRTDSNGQAMFRFPIAGDAMIGRYVVTVMDASKDSKNSVAFFVDKHTQEPELKEEFVRGELLVGLRKGVDAKSVDIRRFVEQLGGEVVKVIEETGTIKIRVPEGAEETITEELEKSDDVSFSSTNKYLVPTLFFEGEEMQEQSVESYELIDIPSMWPVSMREKVVAVLDSGIDMEHGDLRESIWVNDDDCGDQVDDDSNGFVDDCGGWNFFVSSNDVNDEGESAPGCDSHGTHVAGVIEAIGNRWRSDIAPPVTIMPLKVSSNMKIDGKIVCVSTEERALDAVIYAVNNGAKIINISLGCPNQEKCDMPALGEAYRYAFDKGALIVVPAGNEQGIDDWQDYSQYVIEVSSVDPTGEKADYSNTGSGVKLAAPGTHVYSTTINGEYGTKSGTSQAAAMVSGCASLLMSSNDFVTNVDIENILIQSAKDMGDIGRDNAFGYGVIDCDDALNQVVSLDYELSSLTFFLRNTPIRDALLEVALPRALIDSRAGEGLAGIDAEFLVFADNAVINYQEITSNQKERLLRILVPASAENIEILGTVATPEFGVIAVLLLAVIITVGIVMNKQYRRLTN